MCKRFTHFFNNLGQKRLECLGHSLNPDALVGDDSSLNTPLPNIRHYRHRVENFVHLYSRHQFVLQLDVFDDNILKN